MSRRSRARRSLGQCFLRDRHLAEALASQVEPRELVVEFGSGAGALTIPLARAGARVIAVERDPVWVRRLRQRVARLGLQESVEVRAADLRHVPLPGRPFRVVSSPPFGLTTVLLRRLLDDPGRGPYRVDLLVQWEVALKRATVPPRTLLSTAWAPWWEFELVRRVPRAAFRPAPNVDAAWLAVRRRPEPLLPASLARDFAAFVRARWPLLGPDPLSGGRASPGLRIESTRSGVEEKGCHIPRP